MPKKNGSGKKGFSFMGSKGKGKPNGERNGTSTTVESFPRKETMETQLSFEERYSSFVQVPAEPKSKSQIKKQKKKERQSILEIEKMKFKNEKALHVNVLPDIEWESTSKMIDYKKFVANVEEDVLIILEANVFDCAEKEDWSNASSAMNEEEDKSLWEFLRTLEIADSRVRQQSEIVKKSIDQAKPSDREYELTEFNRGIKSVEPIAEELFEEMLEDKPFNQHMDGNSSCNGSTKSRENQARVTNLSMAESPKILYSYNGIPFTDQDTKPTFLVQDIDDGILVINNIRCKEKERFPFRQLDVIMEESSDFSDTSSVHSDKKNDSGLLYKTVSDRRERIFDGRGKTFDLQIQPVIKETLQIFPLHQNSTNVLKTDSTQVRIQTVILEKVHPTSIVKIELPDRGSNDEEDKILTEDDDGVEIVTLDGRNYENMEMVADCKRLGNSVLLDESLSARHLLRNSKEIKFIDEESVPSLSSGGFNAEDGVDADVESELDNRRETFLFSGGDNDLSIDVDEILETNEEPDYNTIKKSPLKIKNSVSLNDLEVPACEADKSNSQEGTLRVLSFSQTSMKNSPILSGRDSVSSVASGGTVKQMTPFLRNDLLEAAVAEDQAVSPKEEINLGKIPSEEEEYNLDSPYINSKISAQMEEMRKRVNVRQLTESLENDLDKILKSKMKVIEYFEEPVMSEASWSNILQNTTGKLNRKNGTYDEEKISISGKSNFSLMIFKQHSNSSSYENVSKSRESGLENENIYEAILTPEALSNLAQKKVMSLPYGHFLLKKIGLGKCCEDTKDVEHDIYTKIDSKVQNPSVGSQHLTRSHSYSSADMKFRCLPCGSGKCSKKSPERNPPPYIEFNYNGLSSDHTVEKWYGIPTIHPALLLGLSPAQRKAYEAKHRRFVTNEQEAANLLDLHKKFIERRSYNEGNPFRRDRTVVFDSKDVIYSEIIPKEKRAIGKVIVTNRVRDPVEKENATEADFASIDKRSEGSKDISSCGLLAILQNATSDGSVEELNDKTSLGSSFEATENTSKEQPFLHKENKIGCESKYALQTGQPMEIEKRKEMNKGVKEEKKVLTAKEMKEEECIITTSLSSVSDVIKTFEEPIISRKSSKEDTPKIIGDIHILLDNEKYRISKKGDIAVLLNDTRDGGKRKISLSELEAFKQKMYNEYMSKVAERIERRQQKQIKLSQSSERDRPEEGKTSDIENEFISKAREKMDKLGLIEEYEVLDKTNREFDELYESELNRKEVTKRTSIQLLLDASSDLAKLPKHLQEFFQAEDYLSTNDNDVLPATYQGLFQLALSQC